MKTTEDSEFFSEVEQKHKNPVASFDMRALTSLLQVYVTTHERKTSFSVVSCSKALKTQQAGHCQHSRKIPGVFLVFTSQGATFALTKSLLTLIPQQWLLFLYNVNSLLSLAQKWQFLSETDTAFRSMQFQNLDLH